MFSDFAFSDTGRAGHFIMEKQYRHGLGVNSIELPCGVMEGGFPLKRYSVNYLKKQVTEMANGAS